MENTVDRMKNMIELNVRMDELMNYTINIPRIITPETFPEILRRMKSVISIIPEQELVNSHMRGKLNPILQLNLDELRDIHDMYIKLSATEFSSFILNKYNLDYLKRPNMIALMGRVRKKIRYYEKEGKNGNIIDNESTEGEGHDTID